MRYFRLYQVFEIQCKLYTQCTHDVVIMSLLYQNGFATSFGRNNNVNSTSCVRWDLAKWEANNTWIWKSRRYRRMNATAVRYMMTSSNGKKFRVTGHLWGEFTGQRRVPLTKASDAELDVFFDLRLNGRLSKQSRRWWFETPSRSLWRHWNEAINRRELTRRWLSARLQYLQCVSNEDTAVLHWAIHVT